MFLAFLLEGKRRMDAFPKRDPESRAFLMRIQQL